MRIGLDAQPLATARTGIGRYVLELCRELDARMPEASFYCYSPKSITAVLPSSRWVERIERNYFFRRMPSYWWLKTRARQMCLADGIDVFWSTRTILPRASASFRTVATVHDLNYLIVPDSMPPVTRYAHRWFFSRDVRRADAVVTNSEATAGRLAENLGIHADGVARPGVSTTFDPWERSDVDSCLSRFGIQRPYFLAVGTLEPRKNLGALISAFLELSMAGQLEGYQLLIVGQPGWKNSAVHRQLAGTAARHVRWLGYVSDEVLAALYQGAVAFVMPSLYEGFGMPVLEARVSGTRVLASDIPELREAGGSNAVYVVPDKEGIKQGLLEVLAAGMPDYQLANAGWNEAGAVMAKIVREIGTQRRSADVAGNGSR